jgi:antitoxin component HigA of HigAB toxin-antitoxin module
MLIAGIPLNSCYDLDTYPGDTLSESVFWKTEEHVKQALMGVYDAMRYDQAFGLVFMFDNMGDVAYGYDAQAYEGAFRGTYTGRTGFVQDKWAALYEGVQRANGFIAKVSELTFLDETAKSEYLAEARFMRALFYFALLDMYGGVPYYDETTNVNADYADMKKERSTADQIRSYILGDLTEAIAKLKPTRPAAEYGRATQGAAYALRGKVYLYNRQWANAIADFEEIVYNKSANYGYALHPSYAGLFKLYEGQKSNEMIFSLQNKGGVGNSYGMKLAFYLGTRNTFGGCWNNSVPATDLVDMYEYPDGKPFNWNDIFPGYNEAPVDARRNLLCVQLASNSTISGLLNADTAKILGAYTNRDPRLMATAIVPYSTYKGWYSNAPKDMMFVLEAAGGGSPNESGGTIRNNNGAWRTYFWRKFVPENDLGGMLTDRAHTPFEFPLIRYADVLLMLSEAYNEADRLDKAVEELNKVRARVNMPGLNSGAAWLAVGSKAEMTERIRKERAIELAVEGHRFSDLRRWGIAKSTLAGRQSVSIYGGFQYRQEFTDRDMLWPIPSVEIERNPLLTQNPGWD